MLGSTSAVAGALIGRAIGLAIARDRARRLAAPQWRPIGHAPVALREDRVVVHWPNEEPVDVAYRTVTSWSPTPTGIMIHRANWAPLLIDVHHPASFHDWFARLSQGRTWRPPIRTVPSINGPVDRFIQTDPRFSFGLPSGWSPADRGWLSWATADYSPAWAIGGVRRVEAAGALNLVVLQFPPDPDDNLSAGELASWGDDLAARFSARFSGRCDDPLELIDLDGEQGFMFQVHRGTGHPDGPGDLQHLFLVRHHTLYDLMFIVVPNVADGSLFDRGMADLHTMLATWRWTNT